MADGSISNAINGELRAGDNVVSYNAGEYSFLAGIVRSIDKLGSPEHTTGNAGDDVHVDFTALEYSPRRVGEIEGEFRKAYGTRREFDELPLDEVIMNPDMLIRANNIDLVNREEMDEILDSDEGAMDFCNRVLAAHGLSLDGLEVGKNFITEKLYSPLEFYLHNPRAEEVNGEYGQFDLHDERYRVPQFEVAEQYADAVELAIRRDSDKFDKTRGLAVFLPEELQGKVHSLFPMVEEYYFEMYCAAKIELTSPLTSEETAALKDWWRGQLSDGWGEGFEQREIKVGFQDNELYMATWDSDAREMFIDTGMEFAQRRGLDPAALGVTVQTGAAVSDAPAQAVTAEATEGFGDKIQALMDEFYDEWKKEENRGKSKWDVLNNFSEAHQIAVAFGNFNYQVENGGIHQWIYNGYFHDDSEKLSEYLESGVGLDERCQKILDRIYKLDQYAQDTDCGRDGYYTDPDDEDSESHFIGDMIDCDGFDTWYYEHCGKDDWWKTVCGVIEKVAGHTPVLAPAQKDLAEPEIKSGKDVAALREKLFDRLTDNLGEYFTSLQGMPGREIASFASEIAVMTEAHFYLTNMYNFKPAELDYLLQFKNPLQVVADEFDADGFGDRDTVMWKIFDRQEHGDYELMSEPIETPSILNNNSEQHRLLRESLIARAAQNWEEYRYAPHNTTPDNLFHEAVKVVGHRNAHRFIKDYDGFTVEQLNCLLQFANPVELVSDYLDPASNISEMPGILENIAEEQEKFKKHYALAVSEPPGIDNPKGYVIAVTDDSDFYFPGVSHIQRNDSLHVYANDEAAAKAAEQDGIKLIYNMPFVPDGIYVDTPENRHAIAEQVEAHRLSLPADIELIRTMRERLDENFAEYKTETLRSGKEDLFHEAPEITAVLQSYYYFSNEHAFTTGQAEFLLKLQNPLELVSDRWGDGIGGVRDVVNAIFSEQERTLSSGSYELASDDPETPPTTVSTQQKTNIAVSSGEKPSVIEEIRQSQKDARENPPAPKDKLLEKAARNKSEADL